MAFYETEDIIYQKARLFNKEDCQIMNHGYSHLEGPRERK
jgi:hypothetical protein